MSVLVCVLINVVEGIATIGAGSEELIPRTLGPQYAEMAEKNGKNVGCRGYEAESHVWVWSVWVVCSCIGVCSLGVCRSGLAEIEGDQWSA